MEGSAVQKNSYAHAYGTVSLFAGPPQLHLVNFGGVQLAADIRSPLQHCRAAVWVPAFGKSTTA
jgi:hypothetical protein